MLRGAARALTLPSDLLRFCPAALALPALLAVQSLLPAQTKLVVISIDGLDARFLNDPSFKVKAPNLRKLMREGASATVVGVAPSETWPAHASLMTGVSPWQHGIVTNDQPASALKTPALWDAAAQKGMKSATIFWPGTAGARTAWNLPELQETHRGNAVSFDAIAQKSTPPGLSGLVEKSFPAFAKEIWTDTTSAQAAIYLLTAEKPAALFVHFSEVDTEEHETGAMSLYAREILENNDDLVGQILAKLPSGAVVAIVSDHGFENNNRALRPRVMLKQAGIAGRVEVADGLIGAVDASAAGGLRKLLAEGKKWGLAREVPIAEVRARAPSHSKWIAAFDTMPDSVASEEERGPAVGPGTHLGAHLFWPTRPNYRSVFILSGPGIRSIKLGEIDMLQVAPTLAEALGVRLAAAKSTSLWKQISK